MRLPRVHVPTVVGRLVTDRGLLLLVGLVVALTSALTSAVAPVTEQTADRAMAAAVAEAGSRGTVVANVPEWYDDARGKKRDPDTVSLVRREADQVQDALPKGLAEALQPGITTITTTTLELLDAGPGRYLQLAFVDTADGAPAVSYTQGRSPRATPADVPRDPGAEPEDGSWPVQVAVSQEAAEALDLEVGDRVPARDEQGRRALVQISGTFVAADEDDQAWQVAPRALHPTSGTSEGVQRTSATALVSPESLADLRYALSGDAVTHRVVFTPDPARVLWRRSTSLEQEVVSLQSGAGLARGEVSWDSLLATVLQDGRAQVASAQGQAQVLVLGLLVCAFLVLVLAAQLLVRRRTWPLAMARQRGATLPGLAGELAVESLLVAALGAAAGLAVTRLLLGSVGWGWSVPVLLLAAATAPLLGALTAGRVTGGGRAPANRTARRAAAQAVHLRRVALEVAVLAAAALSFVALRQRGVVGDDANGGDATAASAVTWGVVTGALVLLRLLPPALRWALRGARRSPGGDAFFVAARLTETGTRVLPVMVACVAVAQLTFGAALATTLRESQSTAALSAVGGDARLDARPDPALVETAREVAGAPEVQAATAGRVEDDVRVSAAGGADFVRLVVVDAAAYEQLLAASDLADAPQLSRLRADGAGRVPALFLGGPDGLRDDPNLRWEDTIVPLEAVGTAPDVEASVDPVVVVDAEALAAAGVVAPPDTVWAVGTGAADAVEAVAPDVTAVESVASWSGELERRRDAALPSAMVRLAAASCLMLLVLAMLGTALAAATEARGRAESLGRLRALGLADHDLRRVLVGELALPVVVAGLAGLGLGVGSAHVALGSMSLERLTGAHGVPDPVVPWWTALSVVVLLACALVVAAVEWRRARRTTLAQLLRS